MLPALAAAADVAEQRGLKVTTADLNEIVLAAWPLLPRRIPRQDHDVPADPYHLMLQGLVAEGWPQSHMSRLMDRVHPGTVGYFLRRASLRRTSARAIAALFDRLHDQNPTEHGVPAQAVHYALGHAERHGWKVLETLPPLPGVREE